ncbi:putative xyloglucan endotransglucosylase/hydrolase protein 16 [Panicum miliaceum]|uniref:Xyloglucan endotransglucosylase/hydrolase protein 16 n=1 Tax=Panicum miliaceum TaxID=4540 RepID=A0A3L6QBW4_PANMI|nr:putative xyloglucan endotransglucosylase/hydrolase protein 16 [Panicum miliaceum]
MAPQLVGGRRAGARVHEPRARRRAVPGRAGHAGAREPVERRQLGDAGGRVKNQLVGRAVRGVVRSTACVVPAGGGVNSCPPDASSSPGDAGAWMDRQLGPDGVAWARENYMIYDYCDDRWRFPQGPPAE